MTVWIVLDSTHVMERDALVHIASSEALARAWADKEKNEEVFHLVLDVEEWEVDDQ